MEIAGVLPGNVLLDRPGWAGIDRELSRVIEPLLPPQFTEANLLPLAARVEGFRIRMVPALRAPFLIERREETRHHLPLHDVLGVVITRSIPSAPTIINT